MAEMVTEEAKLLSEALSTVKIQVQQMKRHLVCLPIAIRLLLFITRLTTLHGRS
jgi:hypothetical protein